MDKKLQPATYVTTIDAALASQMMHDLKNLGYTLTKPEHTLFSAKKKGVNCTLYESGKLVVQGKEKDELIEFYIEPKITKTFEYSQIEAYLDDEEHIGSDEAGKGDFFGPLCVVAAYADKEKIHALVKLGVRDSKTFNDKKISELAKEIKILLPHQLVRLMPPKNNELYSKFKNLNKMLAWAHAAAIEGLHQRTHCKKVIVDQFSSNQVLPNAIKQKNIPIDLIQRTQGENDIVVAAASILARHTFVCSLKEMEKQFNIPLPKGASKAVIKAGRNFVHTYGKNDLSQVCKLHFKTIDEVLA